MNNARLGLCVLLLCGLTACNNKLVKPEPNIVADKSNTGSGYVNAQRVIETDSEPENWLAHGRDYGEQRFSPLEHISQSNIDRLGLAWETPAHSMRGLEATPIVVDGVMYTTSTWSRVMALNAKTGAVLWQYDPKVERAWAKKLCCDVVNRGVAVWQGKVYVGTLDGYLIALDAQAGEALWRVDTLIDRQQAYSITGAPRVIKGKVIIGNGGAEYAVRGYINAYDANSGDLAWRFYTVPGSAKGPFEHPELAIAAKTWDINSTFPGLGGTAWDSIAYDPALDLLYVGTGNGGPWAQHQRSPSGGDNLYLASILALRPDTGELVWHYQTTPGDSWDYTATQQLVLAELNIDGKPRSVIMQAPKNGFFYVLDRATGELLSADAYAHINWASHVDMKTGRPVETEYADYQKNGGSYIWPSGYGAHNWQPMSYSQNTGLMYIPVQNIPAYLSAASEVTYRINHWNTGVDFNEVRDPKSWVAAKASMDALVYGELLAWDPLERRSRWRIRHPKPSNGGTLSTAGDVVFQGTQDGEFIAYDAYNGDKLWQFESDSAVLAGPISYQVDGEQYVAVAQGSGGVIMLTIGKELKRNRVNQNKLLVFKRGDFERTTPVLNDDLATIMALGHQANSDSAVIKQGQTLYGRNCATCHGVSAKSNGIVPDLRYMSEQTHQDFVGIVLGGARTHKGMIGFYSVLNLEDTNAIHAFLDNEQQQLPEKTAMSIAQKAEYWVMFWSAKLGEKFPSMMNATRELIM